MDGPIDEGVALAPVAPPPPPKPISPVRQTADYLTKLRGVLNEAQASRKTWVRQIGILLQDARGRPLAMVTPAAGKIGSDQQSEFGEIRGKLEALEPPVNCLDAHQLLNSWLDRHIQICQVLVEFGQKGDITKLKVIQSLLADGRADLARFQAEYARHVTRLRAQVEAAKKKPRRKRSLLSRA